MLLQKFFKVKLGEYNNVYRKRATLRSISIFYTLYNTALSILKINDKNYMTKCKLWKKYLKSDIDSQKKYLKKLESFMHDDMLVILEAQQKLAELKNKEEFADDSIEKSGAIGIVSYAHPIIWKEDN